jgi:hypothetical protein
VARTRPLATSNCRAASAVGSLRSRAAKGSDGMSDENKKLIREITDVIWNRCGLDRIPEFYAADFVADYRPYTPLREGARGHPGDGGTRLGGVSGLPRRASRAHRGRRSHRRPVHHFWYAGGQVGASAADRKTRQIRRDRDLRDLHVAERGSVAPRPRTSRGDGHLGAHGQADGEAERAVQHGVSARAPAGFDCTWPTTSRNLKQLEVAAIALLGGVGEAERRDSHEQVTGP